MDKHMSCLQPYMEEQPKKTATAVINEQGTVIWEQISWAPSGPYQKYLFNSEIV